MTLEDLLRKLVAHAIEQGLAPAITGEIFSDEGICRYADALRIETENLFPGKASSIIEEVCRAGTDGPANFDEETMSKVKRMFVNVGSSIGAEIGAEIEDQLSLVWAGPGYGAIVEFGGEYYKIPEA